MDNPGLVITFMDNPRRGTVSAYINGVLFGKGKTEGEAIHAAIEAFRGTDGAIPAPVAIPRAELPNEIPFPLVTKNLVRHNAIRWYLLGRTVYEAHDDYAQAIRAFETRKECLAYIRGRVDGIGGARNPPVNILAWSHCGSGWKLEVIR